jgi:fatty-acid desaturase
MYDFDSFHLTDATNFGYVFLSVILAYIPCTLWAQSWMSERPAFELRVTRKVWNCALSLLLLVGFVLNMGYPWDVGFESSYTSVETYTRGRVGFVIFLFSLIKILELIDTAFIVFRKKDCLLVHMFHHINVLLYCWYCLHNPVGTGYWFAQTNMFVYATMYACCAFETELHGLSWFDPMLLSILQILHMVWGLTISILYLFHRSTDYDHTTLIHSLYVIPMYATHLYMFCQFFETKYRFETPVKWAMCAYLLFLHILALLGALRCGSWWTFAEVILWYQVIALGITVGCHRLWSHRSFKARVPTRIVLMLLASMANQGGIYHWSRDHRVHHKESDHKGDPHDSSRGFFYAHMGWLMLCKPDAVRLSGKSIDCSDLLKDPIVLLQYMLNPLWDHFWCFIVPGLYGIWRLGSFWDGLLLFGALRWTMLAHATWCVNSISHFFGYRPYINKPPADNLFTAIVACGEGWHNFHHAFPYDYTTAEHKWWHSINISSMIIDFTWFLGQTYDHKRKVITPPS